MRILLYTIEMVKGVERLMPWRTLVEVVRYASSDIQIAICSAQKPEPERVYQGVKIYSIDYGTAALAKFVETGGWDVVYYPITYRQGLKNMSELSAINARKIAYVPGGLCPLSGSLKLMQMGEAKRALPYLLDTITPHKWIAKKMQDLGFEAIVTQAPLTAKDAMDSGWKKAITALPGIDKVDESRCDYSLLHKLGVYGHKYVLFSGAPAPTRGAILAMKAFDQIAEKLPGIRMVMLMRKDVSSDFTEFDKAVKQISHKDRFVISYENLTHEQLLGAFREAWAVLLPFLIVPSEIPLTYFEVMQQGTPVLTFNNGGTTDYLYEGLKIAKQRSIKSLAKAIEEICINANERKQLADNAKWLMSNHPTWEETSKKWLSIL